MNKDLEVVESYPLSIDKSRRTYNKSITKGRKREITDLNTEENIRVERIKQIMQQEKHLASIKANHEEKMATIKEEHEREISYLQLKHLKEIHQEEMKIKKAKLRSIEYQLQQKENIDPDI